MIFEIKNIPQNKKILLDISTKINELSKIHKINLITTFSFENQDKGLPEEELNELLREMEKISKYVFYEEEK
jgi:hypothetical protein